MAASLALAILLAILSCCSARVASAQHHYDHEPGHNVGYKHLHYFDILMDMPWGVATPGCLVNGGTCSVTGPTRQCCSGACASGECCIQNGDPCVQVNNQCCSGNCLDRGQGVFTCDPSCFAGDTKVRVQNVGLVAIRDVQTGQFVQCLASDDDLRVPQTLSWCEVMNWAHAEDVMKAHTRVTFAKPSGGQGVLTLSPTHMMYLPQNTNLGDEAASVDNFGAFNLVTAQAVKRGDLIVVLKDESNPSAGFKVVEVTDVQKVQALGYYVPAIAKGYLVADGVVVPRSIDFLIPFDGAAGLDGVKQASSNYLFSPLWMKRVQTLGTTGSSSTWDGSPLWPGVRQIGAANRPHLEAGELLSYPKLRDWFLQRYGEWQQNPAAAITLEEVVALMSTGDVWVQPGRGKAPLRRSWPQGAWPL